MPRKSSEKRVVICVPVDEKVLWNFCLSLVQMMSHTLTQNEVMLGGLGVKYVSSSLIPSSRYLLAKQALESGATHLLFLDSDMAFPPDTLVRLIRHDEDMVGVNYLGRRPPHAVTAWIDRTHPVVTTKESTGIVKAWRTGFGVVLIKAGVFENLQPPYFEIPFIPEKDEFLGEDYFFFDAAKKVGIDLYIDQELSLEVDHIGSCALNLHAEDSTDAA